MDNKQYVDSLLVAIEVDTTKLVQQTEKAIKDTSTKLETLPKVGVKVGKKLGESIGSNTRESIKKIDIGKSFITSFNSAIDSIKKTIAGSKPIEVKATLTLDNTSALKSYSAKNKGRRSGYYDKLGSEIPVDDELEYKKKSISFTQQRAQNLRTGQSDKLTLSEQSVIPKQQIKETSGGIDNLANSMKILKENSMGVVNSFRDFATGKVGIEEVGSSILKLVSNVTPLQVAFVAVGAVIVQQMKLVGEAISQVWALMDPKMLQEKGVETASQFEQFETKFEVFLGSAEKAKSRIAEYAEFGAKTPFNLPEIVEAGKLLEQFGGAALATGDNLTMVGDMASASGRSFQEVGMWVARAYSSMKSGRPFGEAAMRLQELGLLSGEARNKLEDLQKSGAPFEKQWGAFTQTMGRFSGMMEKQSHTMKTLISNIEDFEQQMALVGGKPLFDQKKSGLEMWYGWLTKNKSVLKQLSLSIGGIQAAWNSFSKGFKKQVLDNLDLDSLLSGFNRIWESLTVISASATSDDFDIASIITDGINALIDLFDQVSIKILEVSITWSQFNLFVQAGQTAIYTYWQVFNVVMDSMIEKVGIFGEALRNAYKLTPMGIGMLAKDVISGKGVFGIGKDKEFEKKEKEKIDAIKKSVKELESVLSRDIPKGYTFSDENKKIFEESIDSLLKYGAITEEQAKKFKMSVEEGKEYKKTLYEIQLATSQFTSKGEDLGKSIEGIMDAGSNLAAVNFMEGFESITKAQEAAEKLRYDLTHPAEKEKDTSNPAYELRKAQYETITQQIQAFSEEMIEIEQNKGKQEEALLKDHNDNLAKIQKDGVEEQQQIEEDNLEKQEEMTEDYYEEQQSILKDADEKLYKLRQKGDLEERRQKQNHDREMKKLDESYMYDLTEAVKNRDAQAIVDLRRKHEQETEEKIKNYDFEKQRRAEDRALEAEEIQIDRQKRLEDLDLEIQERAIKLQEEHDKELLALEEKLNEQTLKENEAYKLQQQQLDDALKTKLESIATELSKVPGMTEEMMKTIVGGLDGIFGIGGDVDKIVSEGMDRIKTKMMFDLRIQAKISAEGANYLREGGYKPQIPNQQGSINPYTGQPVTLNPFTGQPLNPVGPYAPGFVPSDAVNATGGIRIANKPTLLMVGEAGPELFTAAPLSSLTILKNMNKDNGGKGVGGKLQIEFMGSAPPGLGARERDQIASVLLSAIKETGILQ